MEVELTRCARRIQRVPQREDLLRDDRYGQQSDVVGFGMGSGWLVWQDGGRTSCLMWSIRSQTDLPPLSTANRHWQCASGAPTDGVEQVPDNVYFPSSESNVASGSWSIGCWRHTHGIQHDVGVQAIALLC